MDKENSNKKSPTNMKNDLNDSINKKLEKIIEQTRTENQALRKILEGLEKLNNNSGNKKKDK